MKNWQLLSKLGYNPADIIILHGAGAIIKATNSNEDTTWWKQFPYCGKTFTLDGECLEELAKMMGIDTLPRRCEGRNGNKFIQKLSHMSIPIGNLEIEEDQDNCTIVEKLFAKVENGVLHLAAAFNGGEFLFSSHGGSFDISWTDSADEVAGK